MIEFGETLRKTRESKGLTASQIAEKTRLLVQQIDALEREDFSRIAAPIYGRGFVKLYCEALGLDPAPFVDEFMAIYTGSREPAIRMRRPAATPPPPPPAEPAPQEDGSAGVFAPEPHAAPPEPPAPEPAPPPPPSIFDAPDDSVPAAPAPAKRYAPMYEDDEDEDGFRFSVPPALWRILALGAVAALLLWLLFTCARFLYNASMGSPEAGGAETSAPAQEEQRPRDAAPQPAAPSGAEAPDAAGDAAPTPAAPKRKPVKIAPLYVD